MGNTCDHQSAQNKTDIPWKHDEQIWNAAVENNVHLEQQVANQGRAKAVQSTNSKAEKEATT